MFIRGVLLMEEFFTQKTTKFEFFVDNFSVKNVDIMPNPPIV